MAKTQTQALVLLAAVLLSSFVATPAFALQQSNTIQAIHHARELLQSSGNSPENTITKLLATNGLVAALADGNGSVATLIQKLNLEQLLAVMPVLVKLQAVLDELALPGGALTKLLAPGGVVDEVAGPAGLVAKLTTQLGLAQALNLIPVLLKLQQLLDRVAGKGGATASDNVLKYVLGATGLTSTLLNQPAGTVPLLLRTLGLEGLLGLGALLPQLQAALVGLQLPGGTLEKLLAPGGLIDGLLGPTGAVSGLLKGLGLSDLLKLVPVLAELQTVLQDVQGSDLTKPVNDAGVAASVASGGSGGSTVPGGASAGGNTSAGGSGASAGGTGSAGAGLPDVGGLVKTVGGLAGGATGGSNGLDTLTGATQNAGVGGVASTLTGALGGATGGAGGAGGALSGVTGLLGGGGGGSALSSVTGLLGGSGGGALGGVLGRKMKL